MVPLSRVVLSRVEAVASRGGRFSVCWVGKSTTDVGGEYEVVVMQIVEDDFKFQCFEEAVRRWKYVYRQE